MSRPRIYVSRGLPTDCIDRLQVLGEVTWNPQRSSPPSEEELLAELPGHEAAVVQLTEPLTERVLTAAAPRLTFLSQVAVGLDNIDLEACRRHGITVAHTPGVLTDATADLTLALLLASSRRIVEADRYLREGHWEVWSLDLMTGVELRGKTLGILGMGRIGRAVKQRAEAFGLEVIHCSRNSGLPFPELLRRSDLLSLHAPHTAETHHIIGREALSSMKQGSILVNTARGALVDEAALAEALEHGPLRAAGLDVFEDEPRVHPSLLNRPDVVLLPHIGSATERTRHRMAAMAVEAVEAWAAGRPPAHPAP